MIHKYTGQMSNKFSLEKPSEINIGNTLISLPYILRKKKKLFNILNFYIQKNLYNFYRKQECVAKASATK